MKIVTNRKQCEEAFRDKPYLVDESISFIEKLLKPYMVVFEWGAGCSTLWFSTRVSKVYSVEGSKLWVEFLFGKMGALRLINIELMCFNRKSLEYTSVINGVRDKIDVVLIDGSNRMGCLVEALKRDDFKIIVFDDSQVPKFARAKSLLSGWEKSDFVGVRGKTTSVYIKTSEGGKNG